MKKAIQHDNKSEGKVSKVEPATLINVKIVEIEKTIEVPQFIRVDVEKPIYKDVEFIRPVIVEKEYEKPVISEKEYEIPKLVFVEERHEIPVIVEKEYDKFVPVEVPYNIPVVSMKEVTKLADNVAETLKVANSMLKEISASIDLLNGAIDLAKASIPEKIIAPEIIKEKVVVKDVTIIEDTVHVIGKVIARKAP